MVRYDVEPKRASVIHRGTGDASTRASWTREQWEGGNRCGRSNTLRAANTLREAPMWTQRPRESNGKNVEWSGLVEWKCA
jgi:hypothetical protein